MQNKNVTDLRSHLFGALDALADKETPMEIARARAIADVAQTIINSAKAEVDFCRLMKQTPATGFFTETPEKPRLVSSM